MSSRVEAGGGQDVGVHRRPEGEVPADADADGAELAGAARVRLQVIERGAGVSVVRGQLLGDLVRVPPVGAGLVVGEHGPGRLQLVKDLRDRDDISVPGEQGRRPPDRSRHLENLREEHNPRISTLRRRTIHVGSHRAVRRGQVNRFRLPDDHRSVAPMPSRTGLMICQSHRRRLVIRRPPGP